MEPQNTKLSDAKLTPSEAKFVKVKLRSLHAQHSVSACFLEGDVTIPVLKYVTCEWFDKVGRRGYKLLTKLGYGMSEEQELVAAKMFASGKTTGEVAKHFGNRQEWWTHLNDIFDAQQEKPESSVDAWMGYQYDAGARKLKAKAVKT
jgi:hypothetical protein